MQKKQKAWVKPTIVSYDVGVCRYCNKDINSTDSFVAFLSKDIFGERERSHYECMKKDDELRNKTQTVIADKIDQILAEDKTYE